MTGRMSAATENAIARIAAGQTPYSAAKDEGLALSTIYRAQKRIRERAAAVAAKDIATIETPTTEK